MGNGYGGGIPAWVARENQAAMTVAHMTAESDLRARIRELESQVAELEKLHARKASLYEQDCEDFKGRIFELEKKATRIEEETYAEAAEICMKYNGSNNEATYILRERGKC